MNPAELTQSLKSTAATLGFEVAGACPAVTAHGFHRFLVWLEAGYAGEMGYLSQRRDAYRGPASVLPEVQSLLMLAMHYGRGLPKPAASGLGRIARYAQGRIDYHQLVRERLNRLGSEFQALCPQARWRGVVDTAPLLEREYAQLAGIGWQAKNTMVIHPQSGSWFFLAALLVDCELAYDEPLVINHCGTCRACLDACPTQAFVSPHVLDARRCISYLTIEHRGPIPVEFRPLLGDWVFGCDVCQEVCPWNRFAEPAAENSFHPQPSLDPLELIELFKLTEDDFRARFKTTPLWRPKRRGLLRNAAIVLGNQRCRAGVPALIAGLADREPLVRGACAWALGQFDLPEAASALQARQPLEENEDVRQKIALALASGARNPTTGTTAPD